MTKLKWLFITFCVAFVSYFVATQLGGERELSDVVESQKNVLAESEKTTKPAHQKAELNNEQLKLATKLLPKKATPVELNSEQLAELKQQSDV